MPGSVGVPHPAPEYSRGQCLTRRALRRFLKQLVPGSPGAFTAYGTPSTVVVYVNQRIGLSPEEHKQCQALLVSLRPLPSVVLFWSDEAQHIVLPPFSLGEEGILAGWDPAPLERLLSRELLLGMVLLRLGRYAVGVFQGDRLLASKTGTRYVHGRHRAGGSSQRRFERIREKQADELFDAVCATVQEKFAPHEARLDCIFLGGARETLRDFLKACPYLQRLSPKVHPRVLNVREPRHDALPEALEEAWTCRVLSFGEAPDMQRV